MSMRRMRTMTEGSSIRVMAIKLWVAPSEKFEIHLHLLPDIGILSEVDLVSTERKERLKMGRKKMQFPT